MLVLPMWSTMSLFSRYCLFRVLLNLFVCALLGGMAPQVGIAMPAQRRPAPDVAMPQTAHELGWVRTLRTQAEAGDPFAQTALGACYELGEGVPQDLSAAIAWYEKALAVGWSGAMVRLGKCYAEGRGVPCDKRKAVELWLTAANKPIAPRSLEEPHVHEARAALARALRLGEGVPQDVSEAVAIALPAAAWGLPEAEYELGLCYLATGLKQDVAAARHWLEQALAHGHATAGETLRQLTADGQHRGEAKR